MDENLLKRIKDILSQTNKRGFYLTNFLTSEEQDLFEKAVVHENINLTFSGGYPNAEYKRAYLSLTDETPDFEIAIFKINYNPKFLEVTHRNVLGTLMSLGIKREMIGDIIISDNAYFLVCNSLKEFIIDNFKEINFKPISLVEIEEIEEIKDNAEEINIFINSMRIDLIIAKTYFMSRDLVKEFINSEFVKLNHELIKDGSKIAKENDLISVRKKGRIKLISVLGKSKSGNLILKVTKTK